MFGTGYCCITSIDADHLDIYGDESNLNNAFSEFSKLIPSKNKLFVHSNIDFPGISYGINTSSDYCAQNISIENGVYNFDLKAKYNFQRFKIFNSWKT